MTNDLSDYTLSWVPTKTKSKIVVRCERDGQTIHSDEIAIQRESERTKLAERLVSLGCNRESVDRELLTIASESVQSTSLESVPSYGEEIELESVYRPERFIAEGVSGLSVPIMTNSPRGGIKGQWVAYVRVGSDRIRCNLSGTMRFCDQSLFINPVPADASITDRCGWSRESRDTWLAGNANVDPAELFERLVTAIDHYIEFGPDSRNGAIVTLALWIVLTYHYHAWQSIGYLLVNGPASSGKSTLFRLLRELVYRPFSTDNISAAAIFRTLHANGGTMLLDEAERLRDTKSPDIAEINSMLLAGYQRDRAATRLEKIGDGFKTVNYQVFGPKAIACINGVPPTLQSRCIEIVTQRAAKDSLKPKRSMESTDWQSIRDDLHVMSIDYGDDWIQASRRRDVGQSINGRDYELWQPLLALASWFESKGFDGLVKVAETYALESIQSATGLRTPESDEILLRTLAQLQHLRPTATEILAHAAERHKNVFSQWSPEGVGRRLRTYGLSTKPTGARREYRQSIDDIRAICERYSIDLG
jgi:hypothetical protein